MALPERTFGPSLDGSSAYLDTSKSQWVDAVSVEGPLLVPGGDFVLEAQYTRLGPDLFLSGEGNSVFVKGYFTHEQPPDLLTTDGGAVVRGSAATRLAGGPNPGQFAQAETTPGVQPIGIVDNADGRAFLSRLDGTNVLAETGTPVFLGDIVETEGGASIGITFIDDSTFALGESGRMIIDELVFDPLVGTGQSAFNVLKGVFSFVSGDIANTGDDAMVVTTPVLSIGVRGTTVAGRAAAEGSQNTVTLLPDAGGTVGAIAVSNDAGVQVMSQAFSTTTVTSQFQAPAVPVQIPAATIENLYGDISTVLPPSPSSRGEDASSDSDDSVPQQRATEEQTESSEEGEAESEADDGDPDSEAEIEGELEDGLEEEGLTDEELGERIRPDGEGPDTEELAAIAEEAYEEALEEGLSPEEAGLRARDAVEDAFDDEFGPRGPEDEFSAVAEEAYEQALAEGLSPEEAELRARDALEEVFGDEFGPRIPGGEMAAIAEEAYERALEEGLSPEEAELRARDAVEDMFADEFGPRDDLGREMAEVAEEAYEEALAEGLSQEEAEFRAQDAVEEVFADEFGPRDLGQEMAEVAEEAYEEALAEGLSQEEAEFRAQDAVEEVFADEFGPRDLGQEMAEVAEEAYEEALAEGLSQEEAEFRAQDAVEEVFADEFGPRGPGNFDPSRSDFGSRGPEDGFGAIAEEAYEQALEEGLTPEEASIRARDALDEAFVDEFGPGMPGADLADIADDAYDQALDDGLSPEEASLRAKDAVEDVIGSEFAPEPVYFGQVEPDYGPGLSGSDIAEIAEEAFESALAEGLSPEEAGLRARDVVEDVFGPEFGPGGPESGPPPDVIVMEKADIAAESAYEKALSEGMSVAEAGRLAANAAEDVFIQEFGPPPEMIAMEKADVAAEQAFEQALSEGMSVTEAGRIAGGAAEAVLAQEFGAEYDAMKKADTAAEQAFEQALSEGMSVAEAGRIAGNVAEEALIQSAPPDMIASMRAGNAAERAYEQALDQGLSPDEANLRANAIYEEADSAYEQTFEQALTDGLSSRAAENLANRAADLALVQEFAPEMGPSAMRPEVGPNSASPMDSFYESGGEVYLEYGDVAGEAFAEALSEGLSPAEAEVRAWDAAEDAFVQDLRPSGPLDFGTPGSALGSPDEIGAAAGEAFLQALEEGASPAAAAFVAQGAAASTAREVYGSVDFVISGGGDDFGDSQEAFVDSTLGSAADQAFDQALAEGASVQEAEKAARQVIIRAIDSDRIPNGDRVPPTGEPGRPPSPDTFARGPDSSVTNAPSPDTFARGPDSSVTNAPTLDTYASGPDLSAINAAPDIGGSIDGTIGNELPGSIGAIPQLDSTPSSDLDLGPQIFETFANVTPEYGSNLGAEVIGEVHLGYGVVDVDVGKEYAVVHTEVYIEFEYGFDKGFEKFIFYNPETEQLDDFYINEILKAGVPDVVGTDTGSYDLTDNILSITRGEVRTSLAQIDLTAVTTIKFTGSGAQSLTLDSSASATGAVRTVTGSPDSSNVNDSIFFGPEAGARDFTGVTFSNISFVEYLEEGQRETLQVNASTDFGGASVLKLQQGTGSTTDIFDYTSDLNSGKAAASVSSSSDLTLTEFTSQTSARTQLSENTTGLVEFNFDEANLAVELQIFGDGTKGGTESAILSAVESKLESTTAASNLTGDSNAVLNAADGADMLLVFYESATGISGNTSSDAVMIRYQEDGGDADFSGELSLVASFESVTDFSDTNII